MLAGQIPTGPAISLRQVEILSHHSLQFVWLTGALAEKKDEASIMYVFESHPVNWFPEAMLFSNEKDAMNVKDLLKKQDLGNKDRYQMQKMIAKIRKELNQ